MPCHSCSTARPSVLHSRIVRPDRRLPGCGCSDHRSPNVERPSAFSPEATSVQTRPAGGIPVGTSLANLGIGAALLVPLRARAGVLGPRLLNEGGLSGPSIRQQDETPTYGFAPPQDGGSLRRANATVVAGGWGPRQERALAMQIHPHDFLMPPSASFTSAQSGVYCNAGECEYLYRSPTLSCRKSKVFPVFPTAGQTEELRKACYDELDAKCAATLLDCPQRKPIVDPGCGQLSRSQPVLLHVVEVEFQYSNVPTTAEDLMNRTFAVQATVVMTGYCFRNCCYPIIRRPR